MKAPSSIPSTGPMTRRAMAEVGRIVLQGATIEHLVTLALIKMYKLEIFAGLLVLRGTSLSTKLSKLQYIVEAEKDEAFAEKFDKISELIEKFLNCRNSLAHASYAFQMTFDHKEPDYHFSDISDLGTEDGSFSTKFAIFSLYDFQMCARYGASICFRLSELFEVIPLHLISPGTIREKKPPTPRSLRKNDSVKPKRLDRSFRP